MNKTRNMVECGMFAALLCIFSPIVVPIGPVPISMAVFAVMLTSVVLGAKKSVISTIVYICIGILGVPLFSGGKAGIAALVGPTGGYIWSYIFFAAAAGAVSGIRTKSKISAMALAFAGCIAGIAICYFFGTLQYSLISKKSIADSLAVCVYPFAAFDVLKAVCASFIGVSVRSALGKNRNSKS